MFSIRGAVTVQKNDANQIIEATKSMVLKIIEKNKLKDEDIISFIFTTTKDLDQVYPGRAAREMGFVKTSILCLQEMHVKSSLKKCIRVMILANGLKDKKQIKHIYLKKAANLREDQFFNTSE